MSGQATTQMEILNSFSETSEVLTLTDFNAAVSQNLDSVKSAVGRMVISGLIERSERGHYRLTKLGQEQRDSGEPIKSGKKGPRTGAKKPKPTAFKQRLWNAMRSYNVGGLSKCFSLNDLLMIALNDGEQTAHTENNARQYLRQLKKTGYLLTLTRRQAGTRPGSNGYKLFKLTNDTGELSPIVRIREKAIYDPNTREVVKW